MSTQRYELWKLTPFEKWVQDEGLRVIVQQLVEDINTVPLEPW